MSYTYVCEDANFDPSTATCTAGQWEQTGSVIPPLSLSDASTIGAYIVLCWVVGFIWRTIGRTVSQ